MDKTRDHAALPNLGKIVTVQIVTVMVAVISMLIDCVMIGIYLGDDCVAAYGLTNPVSMLLVALGGLLASGSQILCGRYAGNEDMTGLNRVLTTSVAAGFGGGLIISVLLSAFIGPLCVLLGASTPTLQHFTGQYLSGIVFCLPALVLGQILPSFLQIKNCQRQLVIAAFAQIAADVILDYLNVTLFHGGMFGMAMATVISVYLYILLMFVPCFTRAGYRFSLRFFSFAELAQICGFGLLYLVYKACVAFMNLFLNRLLSARGGVHYVTANSIIFSVELLIGAFPSGFGSTTHMLIGMEKEQHGSLAAAGLCQRIIRLSVIVNLIQIIVVMLGARPIVSLFSPESEATAALSVWGLRLYVLSVLPNTINYIIRNYEQDINHQGAAYLICLLNHIILPVAAGLALTVLAPVRHIWLCFVIGQGLCLFISFAIMHKDMTRLRKESI